MVEKLTELSKNLFCEDSKKHNNIIDEIDKIYKNMIKKDLKSAKDIATDMLQNKDNRVKYIGAAYSIRFGINIIKSKVTLLKIYYFEKKPSLGMAAYILLEECKKKTKHK